MVEPTVTYNRTELNAALRDIGAYLTELMSIDKTLRLVRQRLGTSGGSITHIDLGQTYPFPLHLHGVLLLDEDIAAIHRFPAESAEWVESNMATLADRIAPLTHQTPGSYDYVLDGLKQTHWIVAGMDGDLGHLDNNVSDWKGPAANDFADNFHSPFVSVRENQQGFVETLHEAVEVSKGIALCAQHSVMNAVIYTRQALLEQLELRSLGGEGPSLRTFLIIGTAATAIVAVAAIGSHHWPSRWEP